MSMDLHPDDPKFPEDEPASASPPKEGRFALKAVGGFIAAPLIIALTLPSNSPAPAILFLGISFVMLFFRKTRAFGLGAILFVGVAFLLLLAICGHSSF
ncbi:MAG: hypothetical protein WC661_14470 [Opitutaceae bacterium]|jgi:hypothetical protein